MSAAADLCTLLRVLLAPLFAYELAAAETVPSVLPLAICALALLSDIADGRLARAGGRVSPAGRLFDHGADVLFLFPALGVLARAGRVPALLPCAAAIAFGLYCGDGWRRGGALRTIALAPSRSGTAAGIANYAVAGAAAGALWLGTSPLDRAVYAAALAAGALNAAAALERVQVLLQSAPVWPRPALPLTRGRQACHPSARALRAVGRAARARRS
jgi:phosphatidylglycerophosphate synthase